MQTNLSIHPRNWPPSVLDALRWKERRKLNTSKPTSQAKIKRAIAGIERHLKKHDGDAKSHARLAALKASL